MTKVLMTLESEFPHDERVEKEAKSLLKLGYQVHLLCYTKTNQPLDENWLGIHIHRFSISKPLYKSSALSLQFPFYFKKWSKEIRSFLKKNSIDIIHIHDLPLINVVEKLKNEFGFKTILDLHENWPELVALSSFSSKFPVNVFFSKEKWINYEKKWLLKADGIITVIEEAKERVVDIGVSREKIAVISNTIDLNAFHIVDKTRNAEDTNFSLLYSGGVNKHRGLQIVLHAIKKLKDENILVYLRIVGSGNYMHELKVLSEKLGISKQFIDIGWKSYQEMMQEIFSSQLLIIPHLRSKHTDATIPNKLFQYMYAQKPLLVSNCTPMKRIVESELAGLVYRHDDSDDLSKAIKMIYNNYDTFSKSSLANKAKVESSYHWGVEERKLDQFYKKLRSRIV